MGPGRYIPALASSSPTCRARPSGSSPLQQARDVRAMDQARQGSDQVDAAVMLLVRRQRCAPQAGQRPLHRAPWPLSPSRFAVPKELFHEIRRWRCQRRSSLQLQALAYNLANFMRTVVPRSAAESGAVATMACVRSPMVMCSRATDGRSASKCQGKWPDQTLDHRPDCQWWRQSSEPRTPLGKTPDIRKNLRQFGSHPGNPGSKLSCA